MSTLRKNRAKRARLVVRPRLERSPGPGQSNRLAHRREGGRGSGPVPSDPPEAMPAAPDSGGTKPTGNDLLNALNQLGQPGGLPGWESDIYCVPIIGQIEGHFILPQKNKTTKYEHIIPQLVAIEQNPKIRGLLIVLNTVGGDIEAGLAIAEMVASLSKPTVSLVLGGGHSIGLPIAVATDYSFIAETATITIHPIRLTGQIISVPQTYEYLDKMQDRIIRFIVENSDITEEKLRELMFRTGELVRDVGTVLIGKEAVNVGLVNSLGGLREGIAMLNQLAPVPPAPNGEKKPGSVK